MSMPISSGSNVVRALELAGSSVPAISGMVAGSQLPTMEVVEFKSGVDVKRGQATPGVGGTSYGTGLLAGNPHIAPARSALADAIAAVQQLGQPVTGTQEKLHAQLPPHHLLATITQDRMETTYVVPSTVGEVPALQQLAELVVSIM